MTVWGGNIQRGGTQDVPQIAVQYIYLDFDGELTSYNGEILSLDTVEVQNSSLTEERIQNILAELNARYADQKVVFVTQRPATADYSTIFVGKTTAFDQYGAFRGLAETIDEGNLNKTDNAFVMLDSTATDPEIISTIAHETDHLLGTLNHGGDGLQAYADRYDVSSGITSSGITLYYDSMYVSSGGTATSTTVNSYGYLYVSSGGTATDITIAMGHGGDSVVVYSGGVVHNATVCSGGDFVLRGGVVNDIVLSSAINNNDRTDLFISSGGEANNVRVEKYAWISLASGKVNNVTINSGGFMEISSGGMATSTTVNYGGSMYVFSGGTATSTTVDSLGYLDVSSGGTATEVRENGGYVNVADGANVTFVPNTISGLVLSYTSATLHSGTTATSTTVNGGGYLSVSSGGTATATTVNGRGRLYVCSGGTATAIKENGGYVNVADGANVTFVPNTISRLVLSDTSATLHSGTTATATTVNSGGTLHVSSCGTATATTVNSSGYLSVSSGGTATSTTVDSLGYLDVSSGGTATATTVKSGGYIFIYSNGIVEDLTLKAGGNLEGFAFSEDKYFAQINGSVQIASHVSIIDNRMIISSGGTATSTTVNSSGSMHVSSGGTATSTTVNRAGYLYVSSGGTATSTTVNSAGSLKVSSGGTATSTTVNSGGYLYVSGGIHRGSLQLEAGAVVSAYEEGFIDFTVSDRTTADDYLINDLSRISGAPTYTITVSADQESGTYKLAQGAGNFTGTLTVGDGTVNYGSVTVNGEVFRYNGTEYTLTQTNGDLLLGITEAVPSVFIYSSDTLTSSGSVISGAELVSGGNNSMYVSSGGTATSTTLNSGGYLCVNSGGTANSTTVYSSGTLDTSSGGTANDTTVNSKGKLYVFS
ncbi:MAG: AIDA repeat-containing protein, partial [Lentisphaeria bacterium]|nr:AIDA repeat-containing protein [Lentisphaeria bacterium]